MPELPDLLHIQRHLQQHILGRTIHHVVVRQPVVIRSAIDSDFDQALVGTRVLGVELRGPFIRFELSDSVDLVLNLMLAGKLQHQQTNEQAAGYLCFSLQFDDGSRLNLCDEQKMAKAYLVPHGKHHVIPAYENQGIDIRSNDLTLDVFQELAAIHPRKQVRTFVNDHTILSAIGNAYADEILFEARIHPKTFTGKLSPHDLERLYHAIRSVMEWGIKEVELAGKPIHIKAREHMKVRNRKGEPCPRCGTTIRREGVRGFDVFFCPQCQPASRKHFIDWKTKHTQES